jgi:hypothetical protein
MINISIFVIILILGNIYLVPEIEKLENIFPFISNIEIITYIDIILTIYILHQYYIYYTFSPTYIKKISNFTSNIDGNVLTLDLSDNVSIKDNSTKIIYWIISNNNGTYNNYTMNGISDIINKKVTIKLDNSDMFPSLVLKYHIINPNENGEILSNEIFSVKIK